MSDAKPTILAIDDAEGVRRLLEVTLGKSQTVKTAPDAHSALAWAQLATPPDLVLLDTEPAGMSGYELCKALRAMPGFGEVPVIFLAERRDPQGVLQGFQLGALDFMVKPLAAPVLLQRIRGHLEHLARERAAGREGSEVRIARLVRAMGLHERSLGGNRAQRLSQYARALAQAAGAREGAADLLAKAAPVHDVGKLAVAPELLHKERTLAGAEREQFERHAAIGAEIIGEHEDALLKLARTLALTHHEFWDGSGYPGRLQGNQIPSAGRLMAIVDAFESMTAAQFGGSRMSTEAAVAEIVAGAGTMFDPVLVEALRKAAPELRKVHGAYPERAADAGDDLVIGAPAARPSAAKPAPPPASTDDVVLGGPARDPADDAGLTMMGPLRVGAGAASSDKIREAIQRAAAKAQRPAAPPPPPEARPPVEEKPAAVPLDLQLEASTPAIEKPDEFKRAQVTLAQAQKERAAAEAALAQSRSQARGELEALRTRAAELEAERTAAQAAIAQARAELEALNARVNSRSEAELQLQEARGELQIRANELEATRTALSEARAELDRARAQPSAELAQAHAELQARTDELQTAKAALEEAQAELEARATEIEATRAVAASALSEARSELAGANAELAELRSKPVVPGESSQSRAEAAGLRKRVSELEGERAVAETALEQGRIELQQVRAEISSLRASVKQLESQLAAAEAARSQARAEVERAHASLAELRSKPVATEDPQSQAEISTLRSRVNDLETARAAAAAALSEAHAERGQARAEISNLRASAKQLEGQLAAAEAALAELRSKPVAPESNAELEGLRARVNELQMERAAEAAQDQSRLAETQTAIDDLQRRREDAEATLTALEARVADAQAELETQAERARIAAEQMPVAPAPAELATAPAAPRPIATLLLVAFLVGALAMGVGYLLLHP